MKKEIFLLPIILLFLTVLLYNCGDNPSDSNEETITSSGPKFEPADNECLFILGQADEIQMNAYVTEISSPKIPAGFAFYTSLSGNAVQNDLPRYKTFMSNYQNSILQLAIWTGERQWGNPGYYLDQIVKGSYDFNISALASACKNFGKPIFIRFGYEFDGWHNAYPPDKYIAAYKYFVDKMRAAGVSNVAYVWHSWGVGAYYGNNDFPQYYPELETGTKVTQELWYPGDEYVDWVAMSIFGTGWGNLSANEIIQWLINFADSHGKPVMIAESAAIKTSGQSDPNWTIPDVTWFRNVINLCRDNNAVKAFTYINVDWEAGNSSSTWGDTRIQSVVKEMQDYWKEQISSFMHGDENLYSNINY